MKKLLYILLISLTGFLSSCEDESSYDDSKVTYYVNFDMKRGTNHFGDCWKFLYR